MQIIVVILPIEVMKFSLVSGYMPVRRTFIRQVASRIQKHGTHVTVVLSYWQWTYEEVDSDIIVWVR